MAVKCRRKQEPMRRVSFPCSFFVDFAPSARAKFFNCDVALTQNRHVFIPRHVCRPACSFYSRKGAVCSTSNNTPSYLVDDDDFPHRLFHRQHFPWPEIGPRRGRIAESPLSSQSAQFVIAVFATHRYRYKSASEVNSSFVSSTLPENQHIQSAPRISFFAGVFPRVEFIGATSKLLGQKLLKISEASAKLIGTHLVLGIIKGSALSLQTDESAHKCCIFTNGNISLGISVGSCCSLGSRRFAKKAKFQHLFFIGRKRPARVID